MTSIQFRLSLSFISSRVMWYNGEGFISLAILTLKEIQALEAALFFFLSECLSCFPSIRFVLLRK